MSALGLGLGSIRVRSDKDSSFDSLNPGKGTIERREPRSSMLPTRVQWEVCVLPTLEHGAVRSSVRLRSSVKGCA